MGRIWLRTYLWWRLLFISMIDTALGMLIWQIWMEAWFLVKGFISAIILFCYGFYCVLFHCLVIFLDFDVRVHIVVVFRKLT